MSIMGKLSQNSTSQWSAVYLMSLWVTCCICSQVSGSCDDNLKQNMC